jgi:hypothetical protein
MKDEILVVLKLKFFVTVNEGSNKLLLRWIFQFGWNKSAKSSSEYQNQKAKIKNISKQIKLKETKTTLLIGTLFSRNSLYRSGLRVGWDGPASFENRSIPWDDIFFWISHLIGKKFLWKFSIYWVKNNLIDADLLIHVHNIPHHQDYPTNKKVKCRCYHDC